MEVKLNFAAQEEGRHAGERNTEAGEHHRCIGQRGVEFDDEGAEGAADGREEAIEVGVVLFVHSRMMRVLGEVANLCLKLIVCAGPDLSSPP